MPSARFAGQQPVRVVHSHPVWLPQTQPWLYNLVRHLPASAVQSDIVCERTENLAQFCLPRLHVRTSRSGGRLWNHRLLQSWQSRAFTRFLIARGQQAGAQVVHSHFGNIGWQDLAAVRAIKARHVVSFYGFEIGRLPKAEPVWRERYAELFSQVDMVTTQGPYMAQSVIDLGCPKDKMRVHRLGIESEQIPYVARQWKPGTSFRVLIAAGFVEKKGIPLAVGALARIKDEVPLEITIIGDADRPCFTARETTDHGGDCSSRPRKPSAAPRFPAPRQNAGGGLSTSRFPVAERHRRRRRYRGWTVLAIIEMVATGLPVVSTRHCDIPARIEHRRTGMLAEERDIEGIADCLRWLIQHPRAWSTITDAARRRVDGEYNVTRQGAELAGLYVRPGSSCL